jgi:hypothetical protein
MLSVVPNKEVITRKTGPAKHAFHAHSFSVNQSRRFRRFDPQARAFKRVRAILAFLEYDIIPLKMIVVKHP